jgi:hypothetical protein
LAGLVFSLGWIGHHLVWLANGIVHLGHLEFSCVLDCVGLVLQGLF